MTSIRLVFLFVSISFSALAQKDYKLWLQYDKISNSAIASEYKNNIQGIVSLGNSETSQISVKELETGIAGMLGNKPQIKSEIKGENNLIIGSQKALNPDLQKTLQTDFEKINNEGFIIKSISFKNKKQLIISGKNDVAVLYGVFNFLRLMQTNR